MNFPRVPSLSPIPRNYQYSNKRSLSMPVLTPLMFSSANQKQDQKALWCKGNSTEIHQSKHSQNSFPINGFFSLTLPRCLISLPLREGSV